MSSEGWSADLPRVTAIVVAYNTPEPWLRHAVTALTTSEKVDVDVVLVDNGGVDDAATELSRDPRVKLVRPGRNTGFAGGCNAGAEFATGDYIAFIGDDAVVEPSTLARLIEELQTPDIGIAAASMRLSENPELLNSRGNQIHVLGLSWVGGLGEPETRTSPSNTAGAMGAGIVMSRAHWERLGGFFDHYFAGYEDADLALRTWRIGLRVVSVPDAPIVHRYVFQAHPGKYFRTERNRIIFVTTLWSPRALFLLAPGLIGLELCMIALSVKQGWFGDKVNAWKDVWQNRQSIIARRRVVRREQTVPDRVWMRMLTARLDTPLLKEIRVPQPVVGTLNAIAGAYWSLVRRLV
ncbi:glycosyl hydrolase [Rhizocola hellebori]|uniref:Glycosyl hydrolase n=1 Tax=Rhizocola hellebori TaxID=1392758 RepID=A0A8J3VJP3_9ACTN|nr:glycosyltransferase family 2 protein [Rhizocola hellebori]GIH09624.1 glycosyl hydrolase [Rhizocola hellebori]